MDEIAAEFHVPIFKVGDDLGSHLQKQPTPHAALLAYAAQIRHAGDVVQRVADVVEAHGGDIHIEADTHYIGLRGPEETMRVLLKMENLQRIPTEEEMGESYEDDDECEDDDGYDSDDYPIQDSEDDYGGRDW